MFLDFFRRKIHFISKQFNEIDRRAKVHPSCYISGSIIQGPCEISEGCKMFQTHIEGNVTINRYTSLWGPGITVLGRKYGIEIGSFCSIAKNVSIQEDYHNSERLSTYYVEENIFNIPPRENSITSKGKIVIGNDVWIGLGATILSGINVGDGAIIASNAVVTKNVPSFAVVAGNPAKLIRFRFSDKKIDEILKMRWWDWPIERIVKEKELFLKEFK